MPVATRDAQPLVRAVWHHYDLGFDRVEMGGRAAAIERPVLGRLVKGDRAQFVDRTRELQLGLPRRIARIEEREAPERDERRDVPLVLERVGRLALRVRA